MTFQARLMAFMDAMFGSTNRVPMRRGIPRDLAVERAFFLLCHGVRL